MRHSVVLTPERARALPSSCGGPGPCTFWQTEAFAGASGVARSASDAAETLAAWTDAVGRAWGHAPGRVLLQADAPVGHVLYAPSGKIPRLAAFPAAPSDPAVPLLLTIQTYPSTETEHDDAGRHRHLQARRTHGVAQVRAQVDPLARQLLRLACHDLARAGATHLDAIGARTVPGLGDGTSHPCVLTVDSLTAQGFRIERDHPRHPRLRLDLTTALSLRGDALSIARRLLEQLRRAGAGREPASDGVSGRVVRVGDHGPAPACHRHALDRS